MGRNIGKTATVGEGLARVTWQALMECAANGGGLADRVVAEAYLAVSESKRRRGRSPRRSPVAAGPHSTTSCLRPRFPVLSGAYHRYWKSSDTSPDSATSEDNAMPPGYLLRIRLPDLAAPLRSRF